MQHTDVAAAEAFIAKWKAVDASELATSQPFLIGLCDLLGVEQPHHGQDYMFERPLTFQHADGSSSAGRVAHNVGACYRRHARRSSAL